VAATEVAALIAAQAMRCNREPSAAARRAPAAASSRTPLCARRRRQLAGRRELSPPIGQLAGSCRWLTNELGPINVTALMVPQSRAGQSTGQANADGRHHLQIRFR